jgi:acyl dehydratase
MKISGYPGRFFEDFAKGERIVHRLGRTVTYQDNLYFTHTLLNTNPVHFDKEYAELTEFKRPLSKESPAPTGEGSDALPSLKKEKVGA